MLSEEETKHLALLARLELSEAELSLYRQDLERILDYVGELRKLDTRGVNPLDHVLHLQNVLRDDEQARSYERVAETLVQMSPEEKNGYIVVPRVLYHS